MTREMDVDRNAKLATALRPRQRWRLSNGLTNLGAQPRSVSATAARESVGIRLKRPVGAAATPRSEKNPGLDISQWGARHYEIRERAFSQRDGLPARRVTIGLPSTKETKNGTRFGKRKRI